MELAGEDNWKETRRNPQQSMPLFYCRFVANYPKTAFGLTLSGHILIVAATVLLMVLGYDLFPTNFESLPMHDWNVPWRLRDLSWTYRNNYTDRYIRKLDQQNVPNWFRSKEYPRGNIVLYYNSDENLFTQKNLKTMEQIENSIISMETYSQHCVQMLPTKCMKPASVLRYFDGTFASVSPVFYDLNFTNIDAVLYEASTNTHTKEEFSVFLAQESIISPEFAHASLTRTIIPLGYPLNADDDIERMEKTMQSFLVNSFQPLIKKLKLATRQFDVVYWSFLLFKSDLARQALKDAILATGSLLFIFCFIVYHTKSLWVTSFAIMSIFTSFLAANMIYRIVLDFHYLGFFHIIAVFIILGIGADDLFIFLDVWKNTAYKPYHSLAHRLSDSYRRAIVSMFITSLTTVIAFFASAFSPLLPAKSFGVFAGLLVIVNFISVTIFFPSVVIIHHVYFKTCHWPFLGCCNAVNTDRHISHKEINTYNNDVKAGKRDSWMTRGNMNKAYETDEGDIPVSTELGSVNDARNADREKTDTNLKEVIENEDGSSDAESDYRLSVETKKKKLLIRFFSDIFFCFVTHRVCRWVIVILLMVMAAFFTYSVVHLELDNEQTKFYRSSHNYAKALEFDSYGFKRNFADRDVVVNIVWGLKPRDMSGCHFSDEECEGAQRYDDSFNPNTEEAQVALMNFCETLHSFTSEEIQELHIRRDVNTNQPEIKCFMQDLQLFLKKKSGADWSLPWDYNKTLSFLRSKPLLYDTSCIDTEFPNMLQIPLSYWLNDGYLFRNKTDFIAYSPLIGEALSNYSSPLRIDFSVFFGNKLRYLAVEVNLTLDRFSTGYKTGRPVMDRWENFVSSQIRQMPPGLKNGFQLTKYYWHSLSVQKTMADSARFGIMLGIACAFPILILATNNVIIAFFATLSLCCSTVCVIGVIPLAGWKLGLIESLNMCMVVGLSVDYVVHLAEGYHMSTHTDRLSRVRDMLEEVGISVFSGACTSLGASVFMLFAQILFIIKFGIFMLCTIGFSLIFALGFFAAVMGLLGPSGNSGDIKEYFQRLFCPKGRRISVSDRSSSTDAEARI